MKRDWLELVLRGWYQLIRYQDVRIPMMADAPFDLSGDREVWNEN